MLGQRHPNTTFAFTLPVASSVGTPAANRFPNAEAADLLDHGAANFQRQLVKGDLSSEYENEIRLWLQEVE